MRFLRIIFDSFHSIHLLTKWQSFNFSHFLIVILQVYNFSINFIIDSYFINWINQNLITYGIFYFERFHHTYYQFWYSGAIKYATLQWIYYRSKHSVSRNVESNTYFQTPATARRILKPNVKIKPNPTKIAFPFWTFDNIQQFHTSSTGRYFTGQCALQSRKFFGRGVYCTWFPPCRWQGYSPHGLCKSALRAGESRQVLPPSPRFRTCLLLVIFSNISVYPFHR